MSNTNEIGKKGLKELWKENETAHFEYHCLRSHKSADAELWYRDHQTVTIIKMADCDGKLYLDDGIGARERLDDGVPLVYTVRFKDGFEGDAHEDELLSSHEFFDPELGPPSPEEITKARIHKAT
jgi:hypothetical protein